MDGEINFLGELFFVKPLQIGVINPCIALSFTLAVLPFAMIVTFVTSKYNGRDAWLQTANGSMLFIAFVLPWIAMMLNMFDRRLWSWVWKLGYLYVFSSAVATDLFLCFGWIVYITDLEFSLDILMLSIELIVLSMVLIFSFSRLREHRAETSDHLEELHRPQNLQMVCTRCVEPFVLIAIWYIQAWMVNLWYNHGTFDLYETVFETVFDLDPESTVFQIGNAVIIAWIAFLAVFLTIRLVRRLAYRSKKGSSNDG